MSAKAIGWEIRPYNDQIEEIFTPGGDFIGTLFHTGYDWQVRLATGGALSQSTRYRAIRCAVHLFNGQFHLTSDAGLPAD